MEQAGSIRFRGLSERDHYAKLLGVKPPLFALHSSNIYTSATTIALVRRGGDAVDFVGSFLLWCFGASLFVCVCLLVALGLFEAAAILQQKMSVRQARKEEALRDVFS